MRRYGYRELELDASATPQGAPEWMRDEAEPDREHAEEGQKGMETALLSKDETVQSQEESEITSRDGKSNTEDLSEHRSVEALQSPQTLSKTQEQHVDQEDGLEGSRQHDQLSATTTRKDWPKHYCSTM